MAMSGIPKDLRIGAAMYHAAPIRTRILMVRAGYRYFVPPGLRTRNIGSAR